MAAHTLNDVVIDCIRVMLKPVARLCLRRSIHLTDVIELLKGVFVEVAKDELRAKGEPVSLSRLSVMTGVHRKDVTRLERDSGAERRAENVLARIMVQWQHDPRFSTKAKRPRVLTAEGRESEFAELVRSVNGEDVSPYAVLHEMERLGAIEVNAKKVRLVWRDFAPDDDLEGGLRMWAEDVRDLGVAVENNLFTSLETRNLHLKTQFDNVTPEALAEIRTWLVREGSALHRRAREFLAQFDKDLNPALKDSVGGTRVVLGTFSLSEQSVQR